MSKDASGHFDELFYIVRCAECSFVFVNPRPAKDEKLSLYKNMADDTPSQPVPERDLAITKQKIERLNTPLMQILLHDCRNYKHLKIKKTPSYVFKRIWAGIINPFILKDIPEFIGRGRILDIGCNNGLFLYMLKAIGWKVKGLEINPSLEEAQRSLGIEVLHTPLEEANIPDGSFDVVRLSHVLEHLYEPVRIVGEISRILTDSGEALITVPNQKSFAFGVFKDIWFGAPGHLYCFNSFTLTKLCEKVGLRLKKAYYVSGKGSLRKCFRKYLTGKNPKEKKSILTRFTNSKLFDYIVINPIYLLIDVFKIEDTLSARYVKGASTQEILGGGSASGKQHSR